MTNITQALSLLERLIAFPTVSDQSNRDLIAFISQYLTDLGVAHHIFADETGMKEGLIAHIGPKIESAVVLSGHTDVVPVEGQNWQHDPWALTLEAGRYYGRGTCDMKGFVALALAAVPKMLAQPLCRPIQLALSYDEEPGCLGDLAPDRRTCSALPARRKRDRGRANADEGGDRAQGWHRLQDNPARAGGA